jgi:hypothetical protein
LARPAGLTRSIAPAAAGPQPCAGVIAARQRLGGWTFDQLAKAYSVTSLYTSGHNGAGTTIALFELANWSASDVDAFQKCYQTSASVTSIKVDGGATGTPDIEPTGDIQTAIGLAPAAHILVYEAPLASYAKSTIDEFTKIVDDDKASVLSTSWGFCESFVNQLSPSLISSEDTIFQQAAAEGITVFAAAGDTGSEDCYKQSTSMKQLSVIDPGSQPLVTAVGGTNLTAIGPPPAETVWNTPNDGAGGGGISTVWKMPPWQVGPGVISQYSTKPCPHTATSYCREVPDVSASAATAHGYLLQFGSTWILKGGTSFAAPLWAGLLADIDTPAGRQGFLNPRLYTLPAGTLNDIVSGNNDYTGTHQGLYPATSGFDMASGLGSPNAAKLATALLPAWHTAQEVPGTATLNRGFSAGVTALSCASAGNCSAGGSYTDSAGNSLVFVVDETNGTWGTAKEVPGTATLNQGGNARFNALSCQSVGNCSAGGNYTDAANLGQAFVVSETNGTWGTAKEVPGTATPDRDGYAQTDSVSCASAGNCSAGGTYFTGNYQQAFVVGETNGTWGTAKEVPGTASLSKHGNAWTNGVSCPTAGNCSAMGIYTDAAGDEQSFVVSETNGTWGTAKEVPGFATLNQGRYAAVSGLSCASVGNCSADGLYTNAPSYEKAFVVGETNGIWGTAKEIPGFATLSQGPTSSANAVSCGSVGNCSVGGLYMDASDHAQAFVVDETNGTWGTAEEVPGTATLNQGGNAQADSVSCSSGGNCSAGGYYTDAAGNQQAFVIDEANGTWGTAEEVPGTANLNKGGYAAVWAMSCPSAGNCSAGGVYMDATGDLQSFVVDKF